MSSVIDRNATLSMTSRPWLCGPDSARVKVALRVILSGAAMYLGRLHAAGLILCDLCDHPGCRKTRCTADLEWGTDGKKIYPYVGCPSGCHEGCHFFLRLSLEAYSSLAAGECCLMKRYPESDLRTFRVTKNSHNGFQQVSQLLGFCKVRNGPKKMHAISLFP